MQYWTREVSWSYAQRMLADAAWFEDPEYDPVTGRQKKEDTGPVLDFNDNSLDLLQQITNIKK